ncbi:MAG: ATP-binding protein, partial [Verrucomicrobiota bacterium]
GMTGFELAQMIKERKKTARVPIIFLSAYYNEDQHVLEGYGTGAVDYLHKPVNPAILRSKVAVFAELHRRSRESAIANRALLAEVAERRQAEEQLRETVAELEAFSYSITHDLRAPLRAMQNFSKLLQDDYGSKLDETGEDFLRRIGTSASRMDKLIQDVLVYSRVLRRDLKLEPVDVEKLLRGMFETYPEFQEPKTEVTIEGELPAVLGNEAALTQCFSNLVNNAVKFVPLNTKPRVRISAERNGIAVRFWIVDNGIGMDPKYSKTIFEMFQRLSTNYEGTGIGLAIVRKAAERMGGAVGVESEPGKGSRFWLDLKLADNNEINL